MTYIFTAIALIFISLSPVHAERSTAEMNNVIREFIAENGDLLIESIQTYEEKRQAQAVSASIRPYTPVEGADSAKVTIIEFSDFECPFCRKAQDSLNEVRKRYDGRVKFAYKHLPLDFHAKAIPAAMASMAAHEQGKFWDFYDKMWARQEFLGEKLYVEAAKELKLDMQKFDADRKSDKLRKQLEQDMADAAKVGARGTPFFLINGTALSGAQPPQAFFEVIEAALAAAHAN